MDASFSTLAFLEIKKAKSKLMKDLGEKASVGVTGCNHCGCKRTNKLINCGATRGK